MKSLYLIRHAKSSWKFPELTDHDRPLNSRGKRDAPEMGRRLKERDIRPDLLVSSTALRAMTTCQVIAEQIGYPKEKIVGDRNIFHSGSGTLLQIVKNTSNDKNRLMIFGHNPGFTDFANRLAQTDIWNIPTCGVFACSFPVDHWKDVSFGGGQFLFYDYPKKETD